MALCDQVEDPRQAKGLVRREVTRVLTPGTVVEDQNLDAKGHNFLSALFWHTDLGGGLAWVDVSTGMWSGLQTKAEAAPGMSGMSASTCALVAGSTSSTSVYQGFMRQSNTRGAVRPT